MNLIPLALCLSILVTIPQSTQGQVSIQRDLPYVENGHERQILDIYAPKSKTNKVRPLIVWIHGGAWRAGNKKGVRWQPIVERGYVVASIHYRLSHHGTFPAQIHDCKAAIRWLRAHAEELQINPEKIGVWGSSAGGHLSALVGTSGNSPELEGTLGNLDHSSRVQAVCDWFGPTDFTLMNRQAGPTGVIDHDALNSPESLLVGGAIFERTQVVQNANPMTHIDKNDPPILIVHGSADRLVPIGQSRIFHTKLKDHGVQSTFHIVLEGGHGRFRDPGVFDMCLDFFDTHLKN